MKVTITQFRKDIFRLVDRALVGEAVEFIHKGILFRVLPEAKTAKLSRLTRQEVLSPPTADLNAAGKQLFEEMQREWEKDWSEL